MQETNTPGNETAADPTPTSTPASPEAPVASPTTTEGAPPDAPKVEDAKLTPRFTELARREKRTVERERALKETEAKLKADETAYQSFQAAKAKAKSDPLSALSLLDVDLDSLIAAALKTDKAETVEEKVDRLEAERQAERQAAEKTQLAQQEQAVRAHMASVRDDIKAFVESKPEDFELVKAQGAYDLVLDTIYAEWDRTGGVKGGTTLTYEQAAKLVEDYLFDTTAKAAKGSKKIAKLFEPAAAAAPTAAAARATSPAVAAANRNSPTLSRSSTSGPVTPAAPRPVSAGEDIASRLAKKYSAKQA